MAAVAVEAIRDPGALDAGIAKAHAPGRARRSAARGAREPLHGGQEMRIKSLVLALTLMAAAPAQAGPAEDAAAAVASILDRFNAGDVDAFFQAHQDGATIVDEFAPFFWTGSGSAQHWAGDYARDAAARGITGGRVDHGAPIRAESDGASAYVVLPTVYRFVQRGRHMAGRGSMTFVMAKAGADWKIASWTYSGATPSPR